MKLRSVPWLLAVLSFLFVGPAEAGKFYAGGSVAQSSIDIGAADFDDGSFTSSTVDDTDKGYKVFAGYRLLKFLAIEFDSIDMGEVTVDAISDGGGPDFVAGDVRATVDLDGTRLSALAALPVGKKITILARFGYYDWDAASAVSNGGVSIRDSDGDTDTFYGAGLAWKLLGKTSLRFEYESMTLGSADVEVIAVGAAFGF